MHVKENVTYDRIAVLFKKPLFKKKKLLHKP